MPNESTKILGVTELTSQRALTGQLGCRESAKGVDAGHRSPYLLPYESRGLSRVDVSYSDARYPLKESMVLKNTIPRSALNGIIARKALHWKYEEEVRYIVELSHPRLNSNKDRTQFYLRHEPAIVKEIIWGMRCSHQLKTNLVELAQQRYTDADVYETKPDMDAFDICRSAILP
jgi:hypothetical protein